MPLNVEVMTSDDLACRFSTNFALRGNSIQIMWSTRTIYALPESRIHDVTIALMKFTSRENS